VSGGEAATFWSWRARGGGAGTGTAGAPPGTVAFAFQQQVVAGVEDPVQDGLADDGVGEQRVPVNWNWLKFPIVVLSFDVLVLVSGVSA
jgi:hypothetical protein